MNDNNYISSGYRKYIDGKNVFRGRVIVNIYLNSNGGIDFITFLGVELNILKYEQYVSIIDYLSKTKNIWDNNSGSKNKSCIVRYLF